MDGKVRGRGVADGVGHEFAGNPNLVEMLESGGHFGGELFEFPKPKPDAVTTVQRWGPKVS